MSKNYDKKLASKIDHTLLKPEATEADIAKICREAKKYHFATVCVNATNIPQVAKLLKNSGVKPIAVVGFPLGATTSNSKAFETIEAIKNGAEEIDMVINIGALKAKNYLQVFYDIEAVVLAAHPYPVKVIIETSALDFEEKIAAAILAKKAGAAFVKTSTGFGSAGATVEDIKLIRRAIGKNMKIKASGKIYTKEAALALLKAGADRIGSSASVKIVAHTQKN